MKRAIKRVFSPVNSVILIWPVLLWFGLYFAFYMTDENIAKFIVHHFLEFYFTFFIINVFGIGIVIDQTRKDTLENPEEAKRERRYVDYEPQQPLR